MSTRSRDFECSNSTYDTLVPSVESWLKGLGFDCQQVPLGDGGQLLQIQKKGGWKAIVGMSTALNIVFRRSGNKVNVEIGAGKWVDKAVVGAISLLVLWPLAITAGLGAWEQMNLPDKIYERIQMHLGETHAASVSAELGELERLFHLKEIGAITGEEFNAQKELILKSLKKPS